jgi:hypothetical protein
MAGVVVVAAVAAGLLRALEAEGASLHVVGLTHLLAAYRAHPRRRIDDEARTPWAVTVDRASVAASGQSANVWLSAIVCTFACCAETSLEGHIMARGRSRQIYGQHHAPEPFRSNPSQWLGTLSGWREGGYWTNVAPSCARGLASPQLQP